jgi:hypothetical protein
MEASRMIRAALIFSLTLLPTKIVAGTDGYICTIGEIRELARAGSFISHKGIYSRLIGSTFSINRVTGQVIGMPFSTEAYREAKILDHGSQSNSFKLMIISHPPNIWIKYIYVKEFQEGEDKPFWGTDDGDKIYSGICK